MLPQDILIVTNTYLLVIVMVCYYHNLPVFTLVVYTNLNDISGGKKNTIGIILQQKQKNICPFSSSNSKYLYHIKTSHAIVEAALRFK